MPAPAIEVRDLVVRYGANVAVDGVSFDARAGQIVALLGPNGAGKTSTVEVMEGYRVPTRGIVRVLGMDPRTHHRSLSRRIGVMLQRGGVYPTMSPREAIRLFARYYDESEEPEGLLYRVGLVEAASTPWKQLSGGEQQRLSLALALVGRPWVAFLDEPTAGVDPQGRLAIREVINDLRAAGTSVLLTTHEMQEAERLADRIIILDHGKVVADGTPAELVTAEGGKEIRFAAPPGLDTSALAAVLQEAVEVVAPGAYLVRAEAKPATIAALTVWLAERDIALSDLQTGRERLEDVFLRLTKDPAPRPGGVADIPDVPAVVAVQSPAPAAPAAPAALAALAAPARGRRRRTVTATGRGPGATEPTIAEPPTNSPAGLQRTAPATDPTGPDGNTTVSEPVPTEAVPTEAVPTEAVPTEAVPTEAVPTEPVPTEAVSTEAAGSPVAAGPEGGEPVGSKAVVAPPAITAPLVTPLPIVAPAVAGSPAPAEPAEQLAAESEPAGQVKGQP